MSEPRSDRELPSLRVAYRDLQEPGTVGCPPPDALASLAVGERDPESERVADHVVGCRRCSDDMQVLIRTHAEASASRAHRTPAAPWTLVAAAAVFAIAFGGFLLVRRPSAGPPERTGVERGSGADYAALVTPRAGALLDRPPEEFRWPVQNAAAGYRVKLFGRSGDALWQAEETLANRVTLPQPVRDRLRSGEAYFWIVDAGPPSDPRRLGPFPFTIR